MSSADAHSSLELQPELIPRRHSRRMSTRRIVSLQTARSRCTAESSISSAAEPRQDLAGTDAANRAGEMPLARGGPQCAALAQRNQHQPCAWQRNTLTLCGILLIIITMTISQFSCQTTTTTTTTTRNLFNQDVKQQQTGEPSASTPCNRQQQHQQQPREGGRSGHQRALKPPNRHQMQHQFADMSTLTANANTVNPLPSGHRQQLSQQQQTTRKQRQFNQLQTRSASLVLAEQASQASAASPPEEFSLGSASGATSGSGGSSLHTGGAQQAETLTNATSYALLTNEPANVAPGRANTLSANEASPQQATAAPPASVTNSTPASSQRVGAENINGEKAGPQAPPSSANVAATGHSTTEPALPQYTTPLLAAETIGSPPMAPQPPPTTSSSILAAAPGKPQESAPQAQPTQRQHARRIEESSTLVVDRHSSQPNSVDELDGRMSTTARGEFGSGRNSAISSMPSSTSIITPLIGSPTALNQHHGEQAASAVSVQSPTSSSTSSSMIKPIYVVGNPIGELDYSNTIYNDQQQQQAAISALSSAANSRSQKDSQASTSLTKQALIPQRAEKRLDGPPAGASQQVTTPGVSDATTEQQLTSMSTSSETRQQALNVSTPSYAAAQEMAMSMTNQQVGASEAASPDRMNGPALVYSDGQLVAGNQVHSLSSSTNGTAQAGTTANSLQATTVLETQQSQSLPGNQNAPLPPATPRLFQGPGGSELSTAAVLASSPRRPSLPPQVNNANAASGVRSPLSPSGPLIGQPAAGPPASNSIQQPVNQQQLPNFYQTSPPYVGNAGSNHLFASSNQMGMSGQNSLSPFSTMLSNKQAFVMQQQQQQQQHQPTHVSTIPSQFQLPMQHPQQPQASITNQQQAVGPSRRPLNITRVEHISAECSNDLIRAVIVFNGTFKGIIYSSGYVNDPTCLYVNGTGTTRYEFSIRLNQCGTLGRQELHQPTIPGEARRRDQVMWNTLSIQYNPVIEQEWDEHFRVSCEYGSDFWKTISFSPFNVETSTGSPVVFTINPPQCQMDVLLGHGMGPKIAVDGPVTVGDPLTLLIHMKSEKAGYDILVKNCVAHNGAKQRMQLIDSNGCVVNERFISPFRGTYNDNDLRHVTLYAYLKAFRFTGSPVLYLECEIHMCQSACPPQMCYWRRLSKRSVDNNDFEYTDDRASLTNVTANGELPDDEANSTTTKHRPVISDSLSLFKALQVRQEPIEPSKARLRAQQLQEIYAEDDEAQLVCYRHAEVMVFMATTGALLLLVLTVAITCCLRIRKMTRSQFKHSRMQHHHHHHNGSNGSVLLGSSSLSRPSISPSLLSIDEPTSSSSSSAQTSPRSVSNGGGGGIQSCRTLNNSQPLEGPQAFFRKAFEPPAKPCKQQIAAANLCFKQRQQQQKLNTLNDNNNNSYRNKNNRNFQIDPTLTSANIYAMNT